MSSVISCRGVSRTFQRRGTPPVRAVDSVDLDVVPGQFVAIQGRSGSGKTTLLGLLAGIEQPDAGTVSVLGHDLGRLSPAELARLRRMRIGMVFQSFGLVPSLNAIDNVALPLALDGVPHNERTERAKSAIEGVGLGAIAEERIDELSGGQRQRLGVARALATQPLLVLADEPTGSLDDETAASIMALLRNRVRDLGISLVLVTHDAQTASYADARYRMFDGRLTPAAGS